MNKEDIRRLRGGERVAGFALRPGVVAEKLRRFPFYKAATALYVAPSVLLAQVRINGLLDGKVVICPTPALKKGFFLLRPFTIPVARLSQAVTPKGMEKHGEILTSGEQAPEVQIGLAVVDCLAADHRGCLIGDGHGFFDLSMAILSAWKRMAAGHRTVAVLEEEAISDEPFTAAPWDCFANLLMTERQVLPLADSGKGAELPLFWDRLPTRRIRKITPLWKLWQAEQGP